MKLYGKICCAQKLLADFVDVGILSGPKLDILADFKHFAHLAVTHHTVAFHLSQKQHQKRTVSQILFISFYKRDKSDCII